MKALSLLVPKEKDRFFIRSLCYIENQSQRTIENIITLCRGNSVYLDDNNIKELIRALLSDDTLYFEYSLIIDDLLKKYKYKDRYKDPRYFINVKYFNFIDKLVNDKMYVTRSKRLESVTLKELKYMTQILLYNISMNNGYCESLHRNYFLCPKIKANYLKFTGRKLSKNKLYQIYKVLNDNEIVRCIEMDKGSRKPRLFCIGNTNETINPFTMVNSIRITNRAVEEMEKRFRYDYFADYKKELQDEFLKYHLEHQDDDITNF